MRNNLIRLLERLLTMLKPDDIAYARAEELVIWADAEYSDISGERKRHQVLSRLATEFPDKPLRDLAYLIEKALQER